MESIYKYLGLAREQNLKRKTKYFRLTINVKKLIIEIKNLLNAMSYIGKWKKIIIEFLKNNKN